MKFRKFACMLLAAGMAVSVTACTSPNDAAKQAAGIATESTAESESASANASTAADTESAGGTTETSGEEISASDGYGVGYMEDLFHTLFFDFTVDDAWFIGDTYGTYTAEDGYQLVEVDITVTNTFGDTITMYDLDFQLDWGDSEDGFAFPISADDKGLDNDMLPQEYDLADGETRSGILIFEIPDDVDESIDIELAYQEIIADADGNSSEGDIFLVILSEGQYGISDADEAETADETAEASTEGDAGTAA